MSRFTEEEVDDPAQLEPIASSLSILSGFSRCDKILQSIIDSFSPELKQSILHSTPLTHKTALLLHFLRDDSDPKSSDPPANTSPSFLTCSSDVND